MKEAAVLIKLLIYYLSKANNDMVSVVLAEKMQEQLNSASVWIVVSKLVLVLGKKYPNTGLRKICSNSSVSIYTRRRNYTLSAWVVLAWDE